MSLSTTVVLAAALFSLTLAAGHEKVVQPVSYGPRPFYLVDDMSPSPLKTKLMHCMEDTTPAVSTFSIGHRGACLQFPEHTRESYIAAYRMGAGILECKSNIAPIPNVTFFPAVKRRTALSIILYKHLILT